MSPEMARIVDDYLGRLHRAMRGVAPDVVSEAEREIRHHIDDALAARGELTVGALLDALDRLGPPEEYGREVGLYMMVDRGYREWSVPHMARSTAFWALSTVAGAVVVLIFGLLYTLALGMTAVGGLRLADAGALPWLRLPPTLATLPWAMLVGGLVGLAGLVAVARWFVGQYVRSARPHTLGGRDADIGWVRRTSGRILGLALAGFVLTQVFGFSSGVYSLGSWRRIPLPSDYLATPAGTLSGIGLAVFLLAPVLGVLLTVVLERGGRRGA